MGDGMWYEWRPYVPAAQRRRKAERQLRTLRNKGQPLSPVVIEGRKIARTFWGKAWCDNLERYSDYANRLPRGRSYVRNGSVLDLRIAPGEVAALVSGTDIYQVAVQVSAVSKRRWTAICTDCAGAIDSLVELLQGRLSNGVMERICQEGTGLFPAPREIRFSCSCPDWAAMCKHVVAVLYGIGARLDQQPELLFTLRKVHEQDLISKAGRGMPSTRSGPPAAKVLRGQGLSELFGLEMVAADDADDANVRRSRVAAARGKAGSAGRRDHSTTTTKKTQKTQKRTTTRTKTPHRPPKGARRDGWKRGSRAAGRAKLEALIAEAIVDAYGESEQRIGLYTMIEHHLALPFEAEVLGVRVAVERVALTASDQIVAVCRRGAKRQRIPILDVPLPTPPPAGAEWIEAYRRWARRE